MEIDENTWCRCGECTEVIEKLCYQGMSDGKKG